MFLVVENNLKYIFEVTVLCLSMSHFCTSYFYIVLFTAVVTHFRNFFFFLQQLIYEIKKVTCSPSFLGQHCYHIYLKRK